MNYTDARPISAGSLMVINKAPPSRQAALYLRGWCLTLAEEVSANEPRAFAGVASTLERLCNGHTNGRGLWRVDDPRRQR